jgi:hypothetical protein
MLAVKRGEEWQKIIESRDRRHQLERLGEAADKAKDRLAGAGA